MEALAHPRSRGVVAQRAVAITRVAQRSAAEVVVPIVVLVEVYQGNRADAGVDRVANQAATPVGLDLRTARLTGKLRTRAGVGSAVDAVVVATAVRLGGGIIATGDRDDLRRLAADYPNVKVWSLNEGAPTS